MACTPHGGRLRAAPSWRRLRAASRRRLPRWRGASGHLMTRACAHHQLRRTRPPPLRSRAGGPTVADPPAGGCTRRASSCARGTSSSSRSPLNCGRRRRCESAHFAPRQAAPGGPTPSSRTMATCRSTTEASDRSSGNACWKKRRCSNTPNRNSASAPSSRTSGRGTRRHRRIGSRCCSCGNRRSRHTHRGQVGIMILRQRS